MSKLNRAKPNTVKFNVVKPNIVKLNDDELHDKLIEIFDELGLETPWDGDFDEFMSNPNNQLHFD